MRQRLSWELACGALCLCALAPTLLGASGPSNPLVRRYHEGEAVRYVMKGDNNGRRYQAQADGVVKKDATGRFIEELAWSNLITNGEATTLPEGSASVRQVLSLDPAFKASVPNLAVVDPRLIGPVLDLLNFYIDLQLAARQQTLRLAGDHVLVPHGKPNSWADGQRVLVGEDAIDFDVTLTSIDDAANQAVVTVRHVPPAQPQVRLPAPWMRTPVVDTPNNWVQVVRTDNGYQASVGKETFDVRLTVDLRDGRIRTASMDNPVIVSDRNCADAALTECTQPTARRINRVIELTAR